MRAPPEAATTTNGPASLDGRLRQTVEALPTTEPMEPPMNLKSITPSAAGVPGDRAERGQHGFGEPGLRLSLGEALGVGAQVEELQRIAGPQLVGDEADAACVGQQGHAGVGRHGVVVPAVGADAEVLLQFAVLRGRWRALLAAARPSASDRRRRLLPRDLYWLHT